MINPLKHLSNFDIVLGSGSPRRRELLSGLHLTYKVIKSNVEEIIPANMLPKDAASYLAELKANDLVGRLTGEYLLITADTVVIIDNQILGKPESKIEAIKMIGLLSNRVHKVITGVCVRDKEKSVVFQDESEVTFSAFTSQEVDWFITNFNVMDKAGAYGIQEGIGLSKISHINGSYYNVMGLPTSKLYDQLLCW